MTTVVLNTSTKKVEVFSTARDAQARTDIIALSGYGHDSVAALKAANVPAVVLSLTLRGYAAPGDGGGAQYKRVDSEPAHDGKIQSADGAWWEIAEDIISVRMFGAKGDGTTNDTAAFEAALSIGKTVFVPRAAPAYMVGELDLPENSLIIGESALRWPDPAPHNFENQSSIRFITGSDYFLGGRSQCRFEGLIFDGVDKSVPLFRNLQGDTFADRLMQMRAYHCGFYNLHTAWGAWDSTDSPQPMGGTNLYGCFCGFSTFGVRGNLDSRFTTVQFMKNDTGADLNGMVHVFFVGCRFENGLGRGVQLFGCRGISFTGGSFTNNELAGLRINSSINVTVAGCGFWTNGRSNSADPSETSHISIQGENTQLKIGLNSYGGDDDSGVVTPKYNIHFDSSNELIDCTITDSMLTGFMVAPYAGTPNFKSGTYRMPGVTAEYEEVSSDAAFTIAMPTSGRIINHNGTLTADRAVTLATAGAVLGDKVRIQRTGGGEDYNLVVGSLYNLMLNGWCEIVFDGTDWQAAGSGALA